MGFSRIGIFAASLMVVAGGLAAGPSGSASAKKADHMLYKDASQPVARRVEDLLSRMTLEEKIAQMITVWEHKDRIQNAAGDFSPEAAAPALPNRPRPAPPPPRPRGRCRAGRDGRRRRQCAPARPRR